VPRYGTVHEVWLLWFRSDFTSLRQLSLRLAEVYGLRYVRCQRIWIVLAGWMDGLTEGSSATRREGAWYGCVRLGMREGLRGMYGTVPCLARREGGREGGICTVLQVQFGYVCTYYIALLLYGKREKRQTARQGKARQGP
jgi:hypothetical protein